MVVHQDVRVEHDGERVEIVSKLAEKSLAVVICPEDLRPSVPAGRDVVDRIGEIDSWRSRHAGIIPEPPLPVNLIFKA